MTRKWWIRSALFLASAALAAAPLLAQAGPGGGPHGGPGPHGGQGMGPAGPCDGTGPGPGAGRGGRMGLIAEELDLTAEQRTQIRKIRARYMGGALGDARDAMREAQHRIAGLVQDPAATEDQIRAAHAVASEKALAAALERHRMHSEVMQVLTEEQRQKAAELRKSRPRPLGPPPGGPEDDL